MPATPRARTRIQIAFRRVSQRFPGLRAPLCVTALVSATALAAAPPLVEVGAQSDGWALVHSSDFLALAPLYGLLDLLSTLTVAQHVAFIVTALSVAALWGASGRRSLWRRGLVCCGAAVLALGGLLALYALGTLVPRPMAALAVQHGDDVVIDFHAHTEASWDGRKGWGLDEVRRWHDGSGFDVAYLTDHRTLRDDEWYARANEEGRVRLLPGIEGIGRGEHLNVLGITERRLDLFPDKRNLDLPALRERLRYDEVPPVVMLTIPAKFRQPLHDSLLQAIELSDAAPRGLAFGWTRRRELMALADSLDLAGLAGSDNHGWGSTAAAWSVMRIPRWQTMTPHALDRAIRTTIHRDRRSAVRVIERRQLAGTGATWSTALTVPLIAWALLTRLTPPERMAWIGWIWGLWIATGVATFAARYFATARRAISIREARARLLELPETA